MSVLRLELDVLDLEEVVARAAHEGAQRALEGNIGVASPWLDTKGAAEYLGTSEEAIRSLEKRGKLRAHRPEGARLVFYHRDDLDAFARGGAA